MRLYSLHLSSFNENFSIKEAQPCYAQCYAACENKKAPRERSFIKDFFKTIRLYGKDKENTIELKIEDTIKNHRPTQSKGQDYLDHKEIEITAGTTIDVSIYARRYAHYATTNVRSQPTHIMSINRSNLNAVCESIFKKTQIKGSFKISAMTINDQLKQANSSYVRAVATFTNTVQDMERELDNMRRRKVPQQFIDEKDDQIEMLAAYHNEVDEIISLYRLMTLNLKVQLSEACKYIVKSAQDDRVQQEYLMKYLNINPIPHNGKNSPS